MSGAEETIDEILKEIALCGYEVVSFNSIERFLLYNKEYSKVLDNDIRIEFDVYTKYILNNPKTYMEKLGEFIAEYMPDIIFTQFFDISLIRRFVGTKTKIICFIHAAMSEEESIQYDEADLYVCLSNFIASTIHFSNKNVYVMYPLIKKRKYYINSTWHEKNNILFINPIKSKGIEIIINLARNYSSENFIIFENWRRTQKKYVEEIKKLSNVTLRDLSSNPIEIYSDVKLLLFPSQAPEGFGRCIVEANFNGIPVIASKVGGIVEAAGQILIAKYTDIREWEKALSAVLNNNNYYKILSEKALRNSERFDSQEVHGLINTIKGLRI